jgi:hypothetical protein
MRLNAFVKNGNKIKVSGLSKGSYIVRYENIFRQIIDSAITIKHKRIRSTPIYLDAFIDTVKISFLKELNNGDSLGILFNHLVHEGRSSDSILITKKNGILTAQLFKFISNVNINGIPTTEYLSHFELQRVLVKIKELSVKDVTLLEHIFKRLAIPQYDCLPIERDYFIYLNGKQIRKFQNDECNWNSFDTIKTEIFDIKYTYNYYEK